MSFIYDHYKFNIREQELINEALELDGTGEIFKILTRMKDDGTPLYDHYSIFTLMSIYKNTDSVERIRNITKLKPDNTPVYDNIQMHYIFQGYKTGLDFKYIDFYSQLNKNDEPIFSGDQMGAIHESFELGLSMEDVAIFTKLNGEGKPVFDSNQMNVIIRALRHEIGVEYVDILIKLDKNMVPLYSSLEMGAMEQFFFYSNDKQKQQLKDAIADGLSFNQFSVFTASGVPAEKLRIYRSLYKLGCNEETVKYIFKNEKLTYEEFKEVKYVLACAKFFRDSDPENKEVANTLSPYVVIYNNLNDLNELYESFAYNVCDAYYKQSMTDNLVESIKECLMYGLDPEQIHFLVLSDYNDTEINNIARLLLEGFDFNKIKELQENASQVLSVDEIIASFESEECDEKEVIK